MAGQLAAKVAEYLRLVGEIAGRAKQPDFSNEEWDALSGLVAVERFRRTVGPGDERSWAEHLVGLTQWAAVATFESEIEGIEEAGNLAFARLKERNTIAGRTSEINSLAVYEFDEAGKIVGLITYQQVDPPN